MWIITGLQEIIPWFFKGNPYQGKIVHNQNKYIRIIVTRLIEFSWCKYMYIYSYIYIHTHTHIFFGR